MEELRQQHQPDPELLKIYFEAFKQMTTLTATIAVVIIALSSRIGAPDKATETMLLYITLGSLGISLVISLNGMQAVTRYMHNWWPGAVYRLKRSLATANVFFFGGILGFAWNTVMFELLT